MLGANIGSVGWPACGETDIMEHVNSEPLTHGTIHWDAGGYASYGGSRNVGNVRAYHVYAIEWTPASIKWFVDGAQYHEANIQNSINSTEEFHRPFFLLLNLAVGGNWPGPPNGGTPFPARMFVDYVRVYPAGDAPEHRHRSHEVVQRDQPDERPLRGRRGLGRRERIDRAPVAAASRARTTRSGSSARRTAASTTSSSATRPTSAGT